MSWNYRVCRSLGGDGELFVSIREAYYDNPGDETPVSWTVNPIAPWGETVDELRVTLERMLQALDKSVLEDVGVPSVRFNPNPEHNGYVAPVFLNLGQHRMAVFESMKSYVLSSQIGGNDLILVAVAPEVYHVPPRGQLLEDHAHAAELHDLGFRFEKVDPIRVDYQDPAGNPKHYFHDPCYRIAEECFVYLTLRYHGK